LTDKEPEPEYRIQIARPKPAEMIMKTLYSPVFPLFAMQLESTGDIQSGSVTIKVDPDLFRVLTSLYRIDTIVQYVDLSSGRVEPWTADMLVALQLMQKLGLFSGVEKWISAGRQTMRDLFAYKKPSWKPERATKRLTVAGAILESAEILQQVISSQTLQAATNEAVESGERDRDTLIYRIGMAIYHSKRLSGEAVVPGLEDPGSVYLSLLRNLQASTDFGFIPKEFQELPAELRLATVRIFMCFVAGCYLYERSGKADVGN